MYATDKTTSGNESTTQAAGMIPAVVRQGDKPAVDVFGVGVEILLTGAETGGVFSMYRLTVPPGAGAPPHVHRWDDEAFTVVEGTIECGCGDQVLTLTAGATISLPRDIPHYFRCVGDTPGVMYGVATPAGHEHFFEDASKMAFPPDPAEAVAVCARHGLELVAPK